MAKVAALRHAYQVIDAAATEEEVPEVAKELQELATSMFIRWNKAKQVLAGKESILEPERWFV